MNENTNIRTDFADEMITKNVRQKSYNHLEKINKHVILNYINVLEKNNPINKDVGEYVSIEFKEMSSAKDRSFIIEAIYESLNDMCVKMNIKIKKALVVGLGNRMITSDALGPKVAENILVTAHLYEFEDHRKLKGTRNVAVIQPGVMGQTGLESLDIVKSITDTYSPDIVFVVDALATKNIGRINRVIQINNTGIQPGSGVGNNRAAFNYESLGVPCIALGIATVTSVGAIIKEMTRNQKLEHFDALAQFQNQQHLDLVVTPKAMDEELNHLVAILADALNYFLHPEFNNL